MLEFEKRWEAGKGVINLGHLVTRPDNVTQTSAFPFLEVVLASNRDFVKTINSLSLQLSASLQEPL